MHAFKVILFYFIYVLAQRMKKKNENADDGNKNNTKFLFLM